MTVAHERARPARQQAAERSYPRGCSAGAAVRAAVDVDFHRCQCSLDLYHALRLVEMIAVAFRSSTADHPEHVLSWRSCASKAASGSPAGGTKADFRCDLLLNEAVDYVQPNVVITAAIPSASRSPGSPLHSMFQSRTAAPGIPQHAPAGGLANGTLINITIWRTSSAGIYKDLPTPEAGWLTLPQAPGLGFEPDHDALRELAKG